ncbi:GNAT family N-acetyltransferase [Nonomuraea phyllanthi]|uniref:GNAT family N-acetyltransferase n=1 Tax=Nonomuraea phyllanthi TaxID=2219224 RepID=A0A5C4VDT1_9ACTN|nr:GNAT family N-acetyltransferase [Nonomuraea phyllanthi]KAB8188645.1 GNAT family N-acetyltransferase [Nonomuraea phyllanthi]QFY13320.1 GNAT family N-acetyltransferase [Nonomuraea phyllanthi]
MIEEAPLSDGVVLRPAAEQDAEALLQAYLRNRDHLRRWEPRRPEEFFTLQGQALRLKDLLEQRAQGRAMPWLLVEGEKVVGRMTLTGIVRGPWLSADLGYWVDGDYTGRGLATGAVREVCRIADQVLKLHRIAAGTLIDNAASQNVLLKTGFEPYGTAERYLEIDGRWQDHRLFQRILNDRPAF